MKKDAKERQKKKKKKKKNGGNGNGNGPSANVARVGPNTTVPSKSYLSAVTGRSTVTFDADLCNGIEIKSDKN